MSPGMVSPIYAMTNGNDASFAPSEEDSPKLLVVDDSATVRGLITLMLHDGGYRTESAAGGDEAQALVAAEPPALLITDLNMEPGDGWKLIEFCRAHHPHLPILIVSGLPRGTCPEVERHANGYLPKPFANRELLAEVARLLPARATQSNGRSRSQNWTPRLVDHRGNDRVRAMSGGGSLAAG